jgi:creatinine amidohydrolase
VLVADLGQLTWPDLEGTAPLLILPVGSTEQHGPHLPLVTDTVIATALAARLVAELEDAVLGPVIGVGASGEHQGFPGTLSIGTEVLAQVLTELIRSARPWVRGVVLVNGHGGNLDALTTTTRLAEAEGDRVLVVHCASGGADLHAGRAETSLLLYLSPSLVRENEAMAGTAGTMAEVGEVLRTQGVRALSPNGVLGDPSGATRAEGEARMAEMLEHARRTILEEFA